MYDFYPYKHKKKYKKSDVVQKPVLQSRKLQFRLSGELLRKYEQFKEDYNITNESDLIRELINESIESRNKESWEAEVAEW